MLACRQVRGSAIVPDGQFGQVEGVGMEDGLHWRRSEDFSDAAMGQPGFILAK